MSEISLDVIQRILNVLTSSNEKEKKNFYVLKKELVATLKGNSMLQLYVKQIQTLEMLFNDLIHKNLILNYQDFFQTKIKSDLENKPFFKKRFNGFPEFKVPYFEELLKRGCRFVEVSNTYLRLTDHRDSNPILKSHVERLFNEMDILHMHGRLEKQWITKWLFLMIDYFKHFNNGFLCKWLHLSKPLINIFPQLKTLMLLSQKQMDLMKERYTAFTSKKEGHVNIEYINNKNILNVYNNNYFTLKGIFVPLFKNGGAKSQSTWGKKKQNTVIKSQSTWGKDNKKQNTVVKSQSKWGKDEKKGKEKKKKKKRLVDPKCVFVGNLHPNVTKETLSQTFASCHPISSIRLKKGFAFMNFPNAKLASKALLLCHKKLHGQPMNIKLTEIIQKHGLSNLKNQKVICVHPIPFNDDLKRLNRMFSTCGSIKNIWKASNKMVNIEFLSTRNLETAIRTMHGKLYRGKRIIVDIAFQMNFTKKLYMSYIPLDVADLKKQIESMSGDQSVKNVNITKHRGIFITFKEAVNTQSVIDALDGRRYKNCVFDMYPYLSLCQSQRYSVVIKGLTQSIKKMQIKKDFGRIGNILRLNYKPGEECYISFNSNYAVKKMLKLNGTSYRSCTIHVTEKQTKKS